MIKKKSLARRKTILKTLQTTQNMYSHCRIPTMQGYIRLHVVIDHNLPIIEHNGHFYHMHRKSADEFRRVFYSPQTAWHMKRRSAPEKISFVLHVQNNTMQTFHSFVAWRFSIQSLQRCIRLFLARRRESRRLAFVMALHPRLGNESLLHVWLNGDTLSKICLCI